MAILTLFLLGVANFALHKAVLESRHPLLDQLPRILRGSGGWFGLAFEFFLLLGAMHQAGQGSTGWVWAYTAYSALNAGSAWLILTRRV